MNEKLEEYLRLNLNQGVDNFLLQIKLDDKNELIVECIPLPALTQTEAVVS